MSKEQSIRFAPSGVDGLSDVSEVVVFPDRLEVKSADRWLVFEFAAIAEWPDRPAWLWRLRRWLGLRPRFLLVADRDWFYPNEKKYFAFYTKPKLVVYMPADSPTEYFQSHFVRIQEVMRQGGYSTNDLG